MAAEVVCFATRLGNPGNFTDISQNVRALAAPQAMTPERACKSLRFARLAPSRGSAAVPLAGRPIVAPGPALG
jgi:hypothetical protein